MLKLIRFSITIFLLVIFSHNIHANFYFPPDTIKTDSTKIKTLIYDTVKTEKIVYVYDTLVVYDTIFEYDTAFINKERSNFNIELHGSGFTVNRKLKMESDENQIIDYKNSSEILKPGYSFGVELNYKYKNLILRSGLNFSEYHEKADYNFITYSITQIPGIDIVDNSYWQIFIIDTFYQVIGTDTTQVIVSDSTWIADIDSLDIVNYDTTTTTNQYSGTNKYKYIEIPLIFGKEIWKNNKLSLTANTGFITGFLFKVSGKTILTPNENEIIEIEKSPYIKTNFFLYGGLKFKYYISNNFSFTVSSGYKYMLNSLYNKNNILTYKTDFMNIRFGFAYNL